MKTNSPPSFLLADDHSIVRNGLEIVIKSIFDNCSIHHAGNFNEIRNLIAKEAINVLILDANFPEGTTLDLIPEFKLAQPNLNILIFTSLDEEIYALRYLKAGADGYLSKLATSEELEKAIVAMSANLKYMSPVIQDKMYTALLSNKSDNPLDELSEREMEIASLLVKGYGNLEISNELNLKSTTVSTYKARVFEKLGVTTLVALVEKYRQYNG